MKTFGDGMSTEALSMVFENGLQDEMVLGALLIQTGIIHDLLHKIPIDLIRSLLHDWSYATKRGRQSRVYARTRQLEMCV